MSGAQAVPERGEAAGSLRSLGKAQRVTDTKWSQPHFPESRWEACGWGGVGGRWGGAWEGQKSKVDSQMPCHIRSVHLSVKHFHLVLKKAEMEMGTQKQITERGGEKTLSSKSLENMCRINI